MFLIYAINTYLLLLRSLSTMISMPHGAEFCTQTLQSEAKESISVTRNDRINIEMSCHFGLTADPPPTLRTACAMAS